MVTSSLKNIVYPVYSKCIGLPSVFETLSLEWIVLGLRVVSQIVPKVNLTESYSRIIWNDNCIYHHHCLFRFILFVTVIDCTNHKEAKEFKVCDTQLLKSDSFSYCNPLAVKLGKTSLFSRRTAVY